MTGVRCSDVTFNLFSWERIRQLLLVYVCGGGWWYPTLFKEPIPQLGQLGGRGNTNMVFSFALSGTLKT